MPIYEYKCTICGEHFEIEQSITANTRKTIKGDDHTHKVKKVFHAPGISFKGDGFYKNDARGKAKEKSESTSSTDTKSSDTASSSDKSSSSDTKSDTKSADTKSSSKTSDKATKKKEKSSS